MHLKLIKLVCFLVKYPGEWHTYSTDRETTELVCAAYNLGIAELSTVSPQMRLKSKWKAQQFLNN